MKSFSIISQSPSATEHIAAAIATIMTPPLTLALVGDLGAGKTTFVRGLVSGLKGGDKVRVQSPTFALARTYQTSPPLHHVDLYRLSDEVVIEDLGIENLLDDPTAIVCIEWPSHHKNPLPGHTVWIKITYKNSKSREVEFTFGDELEHLTDQWARVVK